MTKEEFEQISSALEECRVKIIKSVDKFVEEIKNLEVIED